MIEANFLTQLKHLSELVKEQMNESVSEKGGVNLPSVSNYTTRDADKLE